MRLFTKYKLSLLSRKLGEAQITNNVKISEASFLLHLKNSLHLALFLSYIQGLHLIRNASEEFSYDIDIMKLLKIWRDGCIIRFRLLYRFIEVEERNPENENLLMDDKLFKEVTSIEDSLRILHSSLKSIEILHLF